MQSQEELFINHYIFNHNHISENSILNTLNESFVRTPVLENLFDTEDKHCLEYFIDTHHIEGDNGRVYYLNFFTRSKKLVYVVDLTPRIFIDVDHLRGKLKDHICQRRKVHGIFLAELLDETLADILANPPEEPRVKLFGVPLDQRFLLRYTRDFQTRIEDFTTWHSFQDIQLRTYAFDRLFERLGGKLWGCSHYVSLCSLRFEFILRLNVLEIFDTLEEARENSINLNARWETRIYDYVNLDKALPYAVHVFTEQDGWLRENAYLVRSEIFAHAFNQEVEYDSESDTDTEHDTDLETDTENSTDTEMGDNNNNLTHQELTHRIPDYDGESKSGLWSYIKVIDDLIYEVTQVVQEQNQRESTLRLVCQAAKRKLKGKAADLVASVPNEWNTIRDMLLLIYGSAKSADQLRSDLASITQDQDSLESFYNNIRDTLTDLIAKVTRNVADRAAAQREEETARGLALQAFTRGLNSTYHSPVNSRNPTTLEQAYQYAKERIHSQVQTESLKQQQFPLEFFKQLQENMMKQVDAKLSKVAIENQALIQSVGFHQANPPEGPSRGAAPGHKVKREKPYFCQRHGNNASHNTDQCNVLKANREKQATIKKEHENKEPTNDPMFVLMSKVLTSLEAKNNTPENFSVMEQLGQTMAQPNVNPAVQWQLPFMQSHPWSQVQQPGVNHQIPLNPPYIHNLPPYNMNNQPWPMPSFPMGPPNQQPGQPQFLQALPAPHNISQNFPPGHPNGQQP